MTANGRRLGRQIFSQTCGVYRANGKEDTAKRIEKRIAELIDKVRGGWI